MKGEELAHWLALREPVDHRSRNRRLFNSVRARFAQRPFVTVIDLGAGSGSNLRATAAALPPRQRWILVDHDPVVLAAARDTIAGWADKVVKNADTLELGKDGRVLRVEFREADLVRDPTAWGADLPDLVTSSALFDLVSEAWIGRFTDALVRMRLPLYTTLVYDGRTDFMPPHRADASIAAAFAHHHARDKGFGPGIGGRGTIVIAERLKAHGFTIERGLSPWELGAGDEELIGVLAEGIAAAVSETGEVADPVIDAWLPAHRGAGVSCVVGHEDLLAFPG
jgi:hypothetical protein